MNTFDNTLSLPLPARAGLPASARPLLRLLERLEGGSLELSLPDGSCRIFAGAGPRHAVMEIRDWAVFDAVLARGDIGLAEAWLDGQWESPDLAALLTLLAENRERLSRAVYGLSLIHI